MKALRPRYGGRPVVEGMESRVLLSFTVTGTPGPDLIELFHDGTAYQARVNGFTAGFTTDSDILVSALGGDDTISMLNVKSGAMITLQGGAGDDSVRLGGGHLLIHLQGRVFVQEFAGEGNDEILIDDTLDNADTERDFTIAADNLEGLTHRITSILGSPPRGVHLDANTESTRMFTSNAHDTIHVAGGMPLGLSMSLSGGNDQIVYGGLSQHVVPDLPPATVDGGDGFDDVVIDDSGAPEGAGRIYDAGEGFILNQTLIGFENLTLDARPTASFEENSIRFAGGFPVGDNITVRSDSFDSAVEIGTAGDPIDLDSQDLIFTNQAGRVLLRDQDFDASGSPFEIWVDTAADTQRVDKGGFRGVFDSASMSQGIFIQAGSTNDVFEVSKLRSQFAIAVLGGEGNDALLPGNRNGIHSDIDAIFASDSSTRFTFDGEEGSDSVYLSDTADQIGDGDPNYYVGITSANGYSSLTKGTEAPTTNTYGLFAWRGLEGLQIDGDSDHNTFYFDNQNLGDAFFWEAGITLNGGAGNDTFTNYNANNNSGSLVEAAAGGALVGGPGIDAVFFDDTQDQLVDRYVFERSSAGNGKSFLSYSSGAETWLFEMDAAMESVSLDQNNAASTATFLHSKPGSMSLSISCHGGNDTLYVGGGDIDASGFSTSTTTLLGGTGEDQIIFDDQSDDHGPLDNDEFNFYIGQINKDGTTLLYSGFESQTLRTSGVNTSGVAAPNKVRINAINIPTEIFGIAGNRENLIDLGGFGGTLSQLFAPITLSFPNSNAIVNVHDQGSLAARAWEFSAAQMTLPAVVSYIGVEEFFVYAGSGSDTFTVSGTPAGMNIYLNGAGGDDIMYLGTAGGAFSDLAGRVYANGGDGVDRVHFINGAAGGFTDGVLTSGSFRANGGPNHLYAALEQVQVFLNDQGSSINITSLSTPAGIQGGGDDDLVNIGGGDLDVNILRSIFVNGAGGFDRIVFDDHDGTNQPGTPSEYRFDVFVGTAGPVDRFYANPPALDSFFISCLGVEERHFDASNDPNFINVMDSVGAVRIHSHGGSDTINIADAAGIVAVNTGTGQDSLTANSDSGSGDPPLTVLFESSDDLHYLDLRPGATLRVGPGATLLKTAGANSALALSGMIDLAGGSIIFQDAINVPAQSSFRSRIIAGRNGGAWNGTGTGAIQSSLAATSPIGDGVGYGLGSEIGITSIGPFSINPGDSLIRYTLDGDANLDGSVDISDLGILATHWQGVSKVWTQGDVSFDDLVDITDLGILATNWQGSVLLPSVSARTSTFAARGHVIEGLPEF